MRFILLFLLLAFLPASAFSESGDSATQRQFISVVLDADLVRLDQLLAEGYDINTRDEAGWTALHWANFIYAQDATTLTRVMDYLVRHGAGVNHTDTRGRNALMLMLRPGTDQVSPPPLDAIDILVRAGTDLAREDAEGNSALSLGLTSQSAAVRQFFSTLSGRDGS